MTSQYFCYLTHETFNLADLLLFSQQRSSHSFPLRSLYSSLHLQSPFPLNNKPILNKLTNNFFCLPTLKQNLNNKPSLTSFDNVPFRFQFCTLCFLFSFLTHFYLLQTKFGNSLSKVNSFRTVKKFTRNHLFLQ